MFRVRMCNLSFFSSKYTHMQYFQPVFEYICCFYVFYHQRFFYIFIFCSFLYQYGILSFRVMSEI